MANTINSLSYDGGIYPFALPYGTCTTAAATAAKEVTVDNFSLETGAMVVVRFYYSDGVSGASTLNVNGTGAKTMIYDNLSHAGNYLTYYTGWGEESVQLFVYDGTYWVAPKPKTYSNASLGQGYGTCSTAAATAAKVVSLSGYSRTAGGIVSVKFTYDVPASATMNVNSTGAKSIYYRGAAITSYIIKAGDIATFICDGLRYHLIAIDSAATLTSVITANVELASVAEGISTTASGNSSHAEGYYTTALANQHAQGHYNNTTTAAAGTSSGTGTGTAFVIGNGTSSSAANAFRVTYAGKPYACSSMTTSGADYAEFFEWQDSNLNAEDRRGYFVTLDGDKIKIAAPNDYILGIVSALPAVVGNGDEDWRGRYILDDFGAFIVEEFEYEVEEPVEVVDEETGETKNEMKTVTKTGTKYKENPDYDPSMPYIQREDRPEWDTIGMMGVLAARDDGTCVVNGYCKVAEGGIATASESGYRVIKRVNENIVKVVFRQSSL